MSLISHRGTTRSLAGTAIVALLAVAACSKRDSSGSSTERSVHRFLEVQISPDATRVASIEGDSPPETSDPAVPDLVIRSVMGGTEHRVALPCGRVPDCTPGSLAWTPDGKQLTFTLRTPGSHASSVYAVALDGSGLQKLLSFTGTLENLKYGADGSLAMLAIAGIGGANPLGLIQRFLDVSALRGIRHFVRKEIDASPAGARIASHLGIAAAEQRIAVLKGGSLEWASPPDLFVYEYDWRPNHQGFVGTAARGAGDHNWWSAKLFTFAPGTGAARVLYTPSTPRQQLADPKVSHDGGRVAFIAGLMSDFGVTGGDVLSLSLTTGSVVDVTPGIKATATAIDWDCHGSLVARLLHGAETQIVDLGSGDRALSPRLLAEGAETLRSGVSRSACPSEVTALAHESFTAPPEIEVGPIGRWQDLTRVNAGFATPARVRSVTWKSEGFEVQGWLLLPNAAGDKVPLITSIHSGPAGAAVPVFFGPGIQWRMLERGWALFFPNPRGSFGQGEDYTTANVRDLGHGDLRDVLSGIDAVEREAPIDDARLGITGWSYGGFMTMWAVTQTHRFKAAVALAGVSDWLSYYGDGGDVEWTLPYFGASVHDNPAVYARSSPINYIRNVRTPTFVYVGARDTVCPAPQTQEFWRALRALGVATSIMIYPDEGHGLSEPAHAADAAERTLAWFDRYLK